MVVHSDLAYPEGVAAAEILKVGSSAKSEQAAKGGSGIKEIASGGALVGAGYLVGIAAGLSMLVGILAIIVASLVMYALCQSFGIFSLPGGEKFATATAIFTTSIIMAIACISNDNMQDLKTGYLVGATPWRQQVALLLGCVVGAVLGYFLRKHLRAQGGEEAEAAGNRRGTLFASGLIVGESIIGVLLAGVIVVSVTNGGSDAPLALVGKDFADTAEYLGLAVFAASLVIFSKIVLGGSKK